MKPDIVYIYNQTCSKWRGQEIKFSIRSLEKFGGNYNHIIIIGDKPPFLNDKVIHIQKKDEDGVFKEKRLYEKLLVACKSDQVSDPFIFFNDDFFLSKKIDFSKLRFYYFDNLKNKILKRPKEDTYKRALKNTLDALTIKELDSRHFDIHYPMYYNKARFIRIMGKYDWNIRAGYVIKSLYANTAKIKGQSKGDYKIYTMHNKNEIRNIIAETDLFSTDEITRAMAEIFQEMYPDKSSYED